MKRLPLGLLAIAAAAFGSTGMAATTVNFAGYSWAVRSGQGGPGPNNWSAANASVDAAGALHLMVITPPATCTVILLLLSHQA